MILTSKEVEKQFDRGMNYFRAGFFSTALQEFSKVRILEPNYPNIDHIIEASIKRNEEIAGQVSSFIEENFDNEIQELSKELTFERSSYLGPEVEKLLRLGRFNEALERLRVAEAVIPDSRPLLLLIGNTMRRLGMLKEAEKTLLRAKNIYPDDPEIINNLGNIYLAMSQYEEAEDAFRISLKLSADDPRVLNNLGALRIQTNNLDDAERLFRKAAKLRPNWLPPKKNLDNLTKRMESLEHEIESLRYEFLNHPDYLDIGLALAKALFFRGYFSEAKCALKAILKKNDKLLSAYFYMATIFEISGDTERAIQYYSDMVIKSGKDSSSEYMNFEILLKQEFLEEALFELKKIAVLDLNMAASRISLGICYFEDCQWTDALRHFEEAVKINDTYPDAFYWVGLTQAQLKKATEAKEAFLKSIELNPSYADAHFQLGMLLAKRAKKKSVEHLTKALALNLRPSFATMAMQLLNKKTMGNTDSQ